MSFFPCKFATASISIFSATEILDFCAPVVVVLDCKINPLLLCFHLCERKTNSSLTVSGCARWPCRGWSFSSHWAMTSRRSSLQSKCRWVSGGERRVSAYRFRVWPDAIILARAPLHAIWRARERWEAPPAAPASSLYFSSWWTHTREIALQKAINWTVMCFVCFLLSAAA
jgi:hypothetical protein